MFEAPVGAGRAASGTAPTWSCWPGASVGEMYKIEGEKTVIGRGQKAQIRLLDDGISREHAQLVIEGEPRRPAGPRARPTAPSATASRSIASELVDGDKILVGSTTILKFTYHDNLDEIFQKQMYESALRDGLTKAFNKKYFTDRLESEFTFATRHASPLALVLFDIDHFKKVNDTHGHQAGDHVLSELSTLLTGALRAEDVFARYGGEEFAVICRGSDAAQAPGRRRAPAQGGRGAPLRLRGHAHPGHHQRRRRRAARPGGQGRQRHRRASPTRRSTSRRTRGRNRVTLYKPDK